jgi:hypothetical protein
VRLDLLPPPVAGWTRAPASWIRSGTQTSPRILGLRDVDLELLGAHRLRASVDHRTHAIWSKGGGMVYGIVGIILLIIVVILLLRVV